MNITCNKTELAAAVSTAARAVATKDSTPILSGIYLVADKDSVSISATDYEIGTVVKIKADVKKPGKVIVSGRFLQETVRVMPGESVTISEDNGTVKIVSDKASFTLLAMSGDFPKISGIKNGKSFAINGGELKNLIRRVAFACAADETRPVFSGVLLDLDGDKARMVATNSHRLSYCEAAISEKVEANQSIIPRRVLGEVSHTVADDEQVTITLSGSEASFAFGKYFFTTRLIAGKFPDYTRIFPKETEKNAVISVGDFLPALNRVGLIARSSEYNTVRLQFANGEVNVSSTNTTVGKAVETVAVQYDGEPLDISFNVQYLVEALKAVGGETAKFGMGDSLRPLLIQDDSCAGFKHVITPVRAHH